MIIDRFLVKDPSLKRHLAKTITWRIVGTVDTMLIGWLVSGNPLTGVKIGGLEVLTKMILYFIHERVWFKINYGLTNRHDKVKNTEEAKAEKDEMEIKRA